MKVNQEQQRFCSFNQIERESRISHAKLRKTLNKDINEDILFHIKLKPSFLITQVSLDFYFSCNKPNDSILLIVVQNSDFDSGLIQN